MTSAAFPFAASGQQAEGQALSLDAAMEMALRHSDDLESARASVARSEAGRRQAIAAMMPTLTASANYSLDRVIDTERDVEQDSKSWGATGAVSLTIFDGRALQALKVTGLLVSASTLRLRDLQQVVLANVASAYFSALASAEMVAVAERSVESRQKHLVSAEARLEAGHAVRVDVERARAALLRAERDAIDARHQLEEAQDGLALAMGLTPPLNRMLQRPADRGAVAVPTESEAMDRARTSRADLLALADQLEAAERTRTGTWLSFLPQLGLSGTVGVADNQFQSPEQVAIGLTVNLTWALYDGGFRYAQLDQDAADIRDARAALRQQTRLVQGAVRGALRDLRRATAALAAARAEVAAAERAYAAADAAFREGKGIGLDVLDAQLAVDQARAAAIREELLKATAEVALRRALGELR